MPSSPTSSQPRGQPHLYSVLTSNRYRHVRWSIIVAFALCVFFISTKERSALLRQDVRPDAQPTFQAQGALVHGKALKGMKRAANTMGGEKSLLDGEIVSSIFQRHCGWTPPTSLLKEMQGSNYTVPSLVKASMEHCPKSALPFSSIDVWYHQADVHITGGDAQAAARALEKACNDEARTEACIIFMQTELIRSSSHGAALLLRVVQQPFILVSAGNDDECIPYKVVPRGDEEGASPSEIDDLIRSPLLIRWYAKNMCVHAGHSGSKLLPLPLGPKWQWSSHDYDGEDKGPIKHKFITQGAEDPLALFRQKEQMYLAKERSIFVGFDEGSTNEPFVHPYRDLRAHMVTHLGKVGFKEGSGSSEEWVLVKPGFISHDEYMRLLARSAFALSPPGRGLDTHRTWEALSLGTIPIVLRNSLDPLYTHLPVMVIGGLEDLTPKNVHEFYASVRRRVEEGTIGWERATAFYWVQFMIRDARRKGEVMRRAMGGVFDEP